MSQRASGYDRHEGDAYPTPSWVTEAVLPFLPKLFIWEPAAGEGKMVEVLKRNGHKVYATDILRGEDFLAFTTDPYSVGAIVTNPPYSLASKFIEQALELMKPFGGMVAMLLRVDFDSAHTRRHLFADCPAFSAKIVLTKRIRWIEGSTGQPSFNHCWLIWNWMHRGPPKLFYGP